MNEPTKESADRLRWTPRLAHTADHAASDSAASDSGVATPADAAEAVAAELIEIAERGLDDRNAAERIVSRVIDEQPTLLRLAARAGPEAERAGAKAQLASLVRRAALDALPPVVATVPAVASVNAPANTTAHPSPSRTRPPVKPTQRRIAAAGIAPEAIAKRPVWRHRAILAGTALLLAAGGLGALMFSTGPTGSTIDDDAGTAGPPAEASVTASAEPTPPPATPPSTPPDDGLTELRLATPEPAAGEPIEPAAGESVAADLVASLPPVAPTTRVFVHYADGDASDQQADALYAELSRDGGYPLVVMRAVGFVIATPRVRYFHENDAPAADRLAAFLAQSDGSGDWQVQDFTSFRPQPAPGTLEVYVPPS